MRTLAIVAILTTTPVLGAERNLLETDAGPDRTGANTLTLTLDGDGDGNGGTGAFSPIVGTAPASGTLVQEGTGNDLTLTIRGTDTLFAVEQIGIGNVATILVSGTANQMALSQRGTGNVATIAQTGTGNIVAIRQSGH